MDSCEVLIVGGGPAGSTCARSLRNHGRDVLVMDKATFPRDKVCAGWITPAVVDELQIDIADYSRSRVLQPITGFRIGTIGGDSTQTDYGRVVSYGIRRCEFDEYLLEHSGARRRLGEPFQAARPAGDGWIVNDSVKTRWLIGAGGHFCPVARHFLAKRSSPDEADSVVLAQEVEFAMSDDQRTRCAVEETRPELYFCPDLAGYGWVFRKQNVINIGLGRVNESRLSEHVADFCQFVRSTSRLGFDLPGRFHGHAYRLRSRFLHPVEPHVLLIGDAVGLASPHSGEGIRPAVESGLLAAKTIVECGVDPVRAAAEYVARLQARFGDESAGGFPQWLPASLRSRLARALLRSRWFTRHVVLDRWFLNIHQPALSL